MSWIKLGEKLLKKWTVYMFYCFVHISFSLFFLKIKKIKHFFWFHFCVFAFTNWKLKHLCWFCVNDTCRYMINPKFKTLRKSIFYLNGFYGNFNVTFNPEIIAWLLWDNDTQKWALLPWLLVYVLSHNPYTWTCSDDNSL